MFRIIKLAGYALLGYFIYEFFRGLTEGDGRRSGGASGGGRAASTPQSRGQTVETEAPDGGAARHVVGRGVVRR